MAEPIRVLHVFGQMNIGGAETMIMNLYRHIDHSKIQFDFMVHTKEKCAFDVEIEQLGGKLYRVPKYTGTNHFSYKKAWKDFFIEHPEYKIIHGHVRSTASIYLKIAKKNGLKTIAHSHSTQSRGEGLSKIVKHILQRNIKNIADNFLACSLDAGEWLFGEKIVNGPNFNVLKNAIDIKSYSYNERIRKEIRKKFNIEDKFVVGHIGNFQKAKNHKFVIEVFNELLNKNSNSVLILIGDGELRSEVESQLKKLNILDQVIILGSVSNVNDYYQAMDIFLFPSLYEGLGMVSIEAQTSGLLCFVSNSLPQDIFITNNVHGLSLSKTPNEWAEIILEIIKQYERFGQESMAFKAGYDINNTANWLQNFYLALARTKIVFWGMSNNLGGIETYLSNFIKVHSNEKFQIDFLVTYNSICFEEEIISRGSKIFKIPNRKPNPLKYYAALINFFRKHNYDIAHFFFQSASSIEPLIFAKLFSCKTIVDSRSAYRGNKKTTRILDAINKRVLHYFTDKMLAISKLSGESMFLSKPFEVINSSIDIDKYIFNRNIRMFMKKELNIEDRCKVIGHVGRFTYEKNHNFIIDIFKGYNEIDRSSILLLIGDGPLKNKILNKVSELGISDNVIFLGVRDDIPDLMQVMDIFVFPSFFEGLGRVVIEAQASGLYTLVSDKVPEEVQITEMIKAIPLDYPLESWIKEVNEILEINREREDLSDSIRKAGYDVCETRDKLYSIYSSFEI